MDAWSPWWLMAASGAMHGLGPANGWLLLAGRRPGPERAAVRGLLALAVGHALALMLAVVAYAHGLYLDAGLSRRCAAGLLIAIAAHRGLRDIGLVGPAGPVARRAPAGTDRRRCGAHAGLALWSCLIATGQGTGTMLLPALTPMCTTGVAPGPSVAGGVATALLAVGVHLAAMLAVAGTVAAGLDRGIAAVSQRIGTPAARHGWTAGLAIVGLGLAVRG